YFRTGLPPFVQIEQQRGQRQKNKENFMRAGLAQMDILWENVQKNKKKAEDFIKKAKEYDVELLAFPEMRLTGFSMQGEKTTADWKEQRHLFEEMSGRYEMTIAFGYPAPSSGPMCRNHLAVAENGRIRMDYEKIHPFTFGQEGAHFEGGEHISCMEWKNT